MDLSGKVTYVYELPYDTHKELCRLLDNQDEWKELGGSKEYMQFSLFDINEISNDCKQRGMSPTELLLLKWGQMNHKAVELFVLLYKMKHIPAMECMKDCVPKDYHFFIERARKSKEKSQSTSNSDTKPPPLLKEHIIIQQQPGASADSISNNNGLSAQETAAVERYEDHVMGIPRYSYIQLKKAADGWAKSKELGRGGFGSVYKGVLLNLPVAIKKLEAQNVNKDFVGEIMLNQYRHDNILPLYGYSNDGPDYCLVHQYMEGGSLEKRIFTSNPLLTWSQRKNIACGVARGLHYLHMYSTTKPLIHGDIKPANILLDKDCVPKIADFGLARLGPDYEDVTHVTLPQREKLRGTTSYLPPEYLEYRWLTTYVDIYSLGVVLMELATSLKSYNKLERRFLRDYIHDLKGRQNLADLEDARLKDSEQSRPDICCAMLDLGIDCTKTERKERPIISAVYDRLAALNI